MNKPERIPAVPGTAAPIRDLREWLERVAALGELARVSQPVDRDEEMSAISHLAAKQQPSPAVLFERTKGFEASPFRAGHLWNILGPSLKRVALTLEEPPDTPPVELIRRVKDDAVAARRSALGLPGVAPAVRAFEESRKVVYHETGGFEPK